MGIGNPLKRLEEKRRENLSTRSHSQQETWVASLIGRTSLPFLEIDTATDYLDTKSAVLALHIYRICVNQMQNSPKFAYSYNAAAKRLLTGSLRKILAGEEGLLPQWAAIVEQHGKAASDEATFGKLYFTKNDVAYGAESLDSLVETLVKADLHRGIINLPQFSDYAYHGQDLTTLVELAKGEKSGWLAEWYSQQSMSMNPQSLQLAELLFNAFVDVKGMPVDTLQRPVLRTLMHENSKNPDAIAAVIAAYLKMPRDAEALIYLANELSVMLDISRDNQLSDLALQRHYFKKAAMLSIQAAGMSESLKEKALDNACRQFFHYISAGGSTERVPDSLIEYAIRSGWSENAAGQDKFGVKAFRNVVMDNPRYSKINGRVSGEILGQYEAENVGTVFFDWEDFGGNVQDVQRRKSGISPGQALEILGLNRERSYTPSEVKSAWRTAMFNSHPDRNKSPGADKITAELNNAYTSLKESGLAE